MPTTRSNLIAYRDTSAVHIEVYGIVRVVVRGDLKTSNAGVAERSVPLYWYYHVGDSRKKDGANEVSEMSWGAQGDGKPPAKLLRWCGCEGYKWIPKRTIPEGTVLWSEIV